MTKLGVFVAMVVAILSGLVLPAGAQYPGTTSTTAATAAPNVVSQFAGTLAVGQTTTVSSCSLRPGPVNLSLNGRAGATDVVDADGCARTTLAVLGVSQVRVEGIVFPAKCGPDANTLSVSGATTSGTTQIVNSVFGIDCPAQPAGGLLPRTGALVLRWSLLGGALVSVGALLLLAQRSRPTSAGA